MPRVLPTACQIFLNVAVVLATSSCAGQATAVEAEGETSRTVAIQHVKREDLGRTLTLAAEFRPFQEIDLHAKVAGYLQAIYVDVGDRVEKGQLIAVLEAPEMSQELAQAEAALKRARVDVERVRSELRRSQAQESIRRVSFERISSVVKTRPNLVAQQEIDDASARLREAEAQLSAAESTVTASEEQVQIAAAAKERYSTLLMYLRITAPFAGTITRRLADPGAMIQAGTASSVQAMPVVQLSQVNHLRLVLPVPESIVPRIRVDVPVEVRVESLNRAFQGRVARFTGKLDSSTRTMETEVDLPNPDGVIKAGMFGYATLVLERRQNVLTVPIEALGSRSEPITVLVVGSDGRLQERQVKTGMETPDRVEVMSGLDEGDAVVVGARSNLRRGLLVEPQVSTATSDARAH
jgi:RND family efflux transporter MFP subunit